MKTIRKTNLFTSVIIILIAHASYGFQSEENSLLWKITGTDLKQESYLFGTIHLICKEEFNIDERISKAFESAEILALEINMADPNLMAEMQQLSVNPGMKNLEDEFSPEAAKYIDEFLKENYGAGLAQLGILKPFVISSMIMVKKLPCDEQSSYEMYFVEQAKDQDMEIVGLETVGFQMGIFDQIPQKIQLEDLEKMVTDPNSMDEFEELIKAYRLEDIEELQNLISKNEMFKQYGDLLLKNRNENWIAPIKKLIRSQSTFIAVGAGHLASETGIIQLLRNAGYTVEAIL